MRLAVIPARGGSKRIPRKNIKPFCGKPMIAWSIEAALESECFDRVIVSTDDDEIAEVARSCGADVPFMRPANLSDDHTATIPVIKHAIEWQQENGAEPSEVCCIYATAPFVQSADIARGLDLPRFDGLCVRLFGCQLSVSDPASDKDHVQQPRGDVQSRAFCQPFSRS